MEQKDRQLTRPSVRDASNQLRPYKTENGKKRKTSHHTLLHTKRRLLRISNKNRFNATPKSQQKASYKK
jgi:hypothetical protein